ncbi:MAG: hypothetical protein Q8934_17335 [Bacillota bacterium]|nr:hypothetical protein [Bacillota bacterium]
MTKKFNKGSKNQNSPTANTNTEFSTEFASGDNSKGNNRNKSQKGKKNK